MTQALNSGISYGSKYEEFEAASLANIPLDRWIAGGVDIDTKAEILAWYRLRKLVEVHAADSQRVASNALKRAQKNGTGTKA